MTKHEIIVARDDGFRSGKRAGTIALAVGVQIAAGSDTGFVALVGSAINMEGFPAAEFQTRKISWACYLRKLLTARKLHSADSGCLLLEWGIV